MSIDQKIIIVASVMSLISAFVAYWKGFTRGRREGFGLTGYWRVRAEKAERRVLLIDDRLMKIEKQAARIGLTPGEAVAFNELQRRFTQ